jgi:hypothetical protein
MYCFTQYNGRPAEGPRIHFLGAFAELRKASINFFMSVSLSVRMELGCRWTDFYEI